MLKNHFLLLMLKTVVLLNIFVETDTSLFREQSSKEQHLFDIVFTVTFDQFNASLIKVFVSPFY